MIDEIDEKAGLTCHDEASSTVKIKGCYLHQPDHLVTLRYRITDDGAIDKVSATILRNNVTTEGDTAHQGLQRHRGRIDRAPLGV